MLNQEQIDQYKKRLEEERERLLTEMKGNLRPDNFGDEADHEDEEADEAEELSNKISGYASNRDRVNKIDSALMQITNGKYGICTKCGSQISTEVLSIAPESDLCENCK